MRNGSPSELVEEPGGAIERRLPEIGYELLRVS
jgi:hypothetical protein